LVCVGSRSGDEGELVMFNIVKRPESQESGLLVMFNIVNLLEMGMGGCF
jgi:hypothetical protein